MNQCRANDDQDALKLEALRMLLRQAIQNDVGVRSVGKGVASPPRGQNRPYAVPHGRTAAICPPAVSCDSSYFTSFLPVIRSRFLK